MSRMDPALWRVDNWEGWLADRDRARDEFHERKKRRRHPSKRAVFEGIRMSKRIMIGDFDPPESVYTTFARAQALLRWAELRARDLVRELTWMR
jgi:hypothetical protein